MRVIIDGRLYGLYHRGIGRYLVELVPRLAALTPQDEFILLTHPTNSSLQLGHNVRIVHARQPVYSLAEQITLPLLIRKLKPDLIHYPNFNVPLISPRPYLVTVHDLTVHHYPSSRATTRPGPVYLAKLLAYRIVVSRAVRRAAGIITISQAVKQDIVAHYPSAARKLAVIPLAPAPYLAPARTNVAAPYVLAVGAAYPHKNLSTLLQAVVLARKTVPNLRLVIVGRSDFFMRRLQTEAGNVPFVDFVGETTDDILAGLYSGASVYALPSLTEGFGLGALEAMQYGAPVLAADIPVLREVLGQAASFIDARSAQNLANGILRLLTDKALVASLRQAAPDCLNKYNWTKTAQATLEMYRRAVE